MTHFQFCGLFLRRVTAELTMLTPTLTASFHMARGERGSTSDSLGISRSRPLASLDNSSGQEIVVRLVGRGFTRVIASSRSQWRRETRSLSKSIDFFQTRVRIEIRFFRFPHVCLLWAIPLVCVRGVLKLVMTTLCAHKLRLTLQQDLLTHLRFDSL